MSHKIQTLVVALITFAVLVAYSTFAFAADGATAPAPTGISAITDAVIQILVPVVVVFASWAAHRLIRVFETKAKVDIPNKQEAKIDHWIDAGIYWAEEKSRQAVKKQTDKLKGHEKLEMVTEAVYSLAQRNGWIDWAKDAIAQKIEARLGVMRANGGKPELDSADGGQ